MTPYLQAANFTVQGTRGIHVLLPGFELPNASVSHVRIGNVRCFVGCSGQEQAIWDGSLQRSAWNGASADHHDVC